MSALSRLRGVYPAACGFETGMKLDFGYYLPKREADLQIPSLSGRWRRLSATRLIGIGLVVVLLCAIAAPALIGSAYLAGGE